MGVVSDGSYNIPKGLIFSFPVTCQANGRYQIVQVRKPRIAQFDTKIYRM